MSLVKDKLADGWLSVRLFNYEVNRIQHKKSPFFIIIIFGSQ